MLFSSPQVLPTAPYVPWTVAAPQFSSKIAPFPPQAHSPGDHIIAYPLPLLLKGNRGPLPKWSRPLVGVPLAHAVMLDWDVCLR